MLSRRHVVCFAAAIAISIPGRARAAEGDEPKKPYATKGEWEFGGSASVDWTSDVLTVTLGPSVGYFIEDRIEVSASFDFQLIREKDSVTGDFNTTKKGVVEVEPSYHLPIQEGLFALAGLGLGIGFDGGTDFEIIPRVGLNLQIGRSGILTPSVKVPIIFDGGTTAGVEFEIAISTTW